MILRHHVGPATRVGRANILNAHYGHIGIGIVTSGSRV
jgi:hypothetical protein